MVCGMTTACSCVRVHMCTYVRVWCGCVHVSVCMRGVSGFGGRETRVVALSKRVRVYERTHAALHRIPRASERHGGRTVLGSAKGDHPDERM